MRQAKSTQTALSVFMTISIIAILLLVSPAQAVQLDANVPTDAMVGEQTTFELKVDIEPVEQVPIDDVTVVIDGPSGEQTCVFEVDGSPVSGCEGLTITPTRNTATYQQDFNFGFGYDGTADVNTFFGYGYGYGYVPSETMELVWEVEWDTTTKLAGDYTINYFFRSSGSEAERNFVLKNERQITLEQADYDATVTIKEGFPQGNNYIFECSVNGFTPVGYDWNFGDGQKLIDVENQNVYHTYTKPGKHSVTCVAADAQGNVAIGFTTVHINQQAALTLRVKEYYPQNNNYVFVCEEEGFEAESYDWFFGDGSALFEYNSNNVYHTFNEAGDYTVTCVANNAKGEELTSMIGVSVSEEDLPVQNTCFESLSDIPASCAGGDITYDDPKFTQEGERINCRVITCTPDSEAQDVTAYACEKPNQSNKTHFEMYKVGGESGIVDICLGENCVGLNSGFAQSETYPMCHS